MALARRLALSLAAACAWLALVGGPANAEWQPPGLQPADVALADVLAINAKATGTAAPGFAQRREHWTYANGALRLSVEVVVKGDDFRADLALNGARYAAGRREGTRWRADANGIAHATLSDLQGDALDRIPQSAFGWSAADCALAGQTRGANPAWVIADRPARDKPHWFFIDQASGLIVREMTREGARTVVTAFDEFAPLGGVLRARHWRVSDGARGNDLDVRADAVEPARLADAGFAVPSHRAVFAPLGAASGTLVLPTRFDGRQIIVYVSFGKWRRVPFVLDTGTASITLDRGLAAGLGLQPALEHASVPRMEVGGLAASDVSTLAIPFAGSNARGILGYDFFFGHVVHVDYAHQRVEVLPHASGDAIFRDARTTTLAANVAEGLPLAEVILGGASSERFAIDTGSEWLVAFEPFRRRNAADIAAHWTAAAAERGPSIVAYLEGSVRVAAWNAPEFGLGPSRFGEVAVALQETRNDRPDALDVPFDGIVGTDALSLFDCWFDYDNDRIGLRRNG